jgi:hypothetical protein
VDNTPAQIAATKKYAARRVVKVAAVALLAEPAVGAPSAGLMETLPLPTAAPSQEKLKAETLSKLVFEQLSILTKAELDNP